MERSGLCITEYMKPDVNEADLYRHTCAVLHVHMTILDILGNNWLVVFVCIVLQEMDKMLD